MLGLNQNIFSSRQLHVSVIYGHHQAGHKKENQHAVMFRVEISVL